MSQPTISETLGEFDAGLFMEKVQESLKLVALGVVNSGKKGQVKITLDLGRIGDSSSVQVNHTLKYVKPTKNGKSVEENSTSTPMYVDNLGYLTIHPQTQADLFTSSEKVAQFKGKN